MAASSAPAQPPLRVRVAMPHYCADQASESGYGSTRAGSRSKRVVALGRCLAALQALAERPGEGDWLMQHSPDPGPQPLPNQPLLAATGHRPVELEVVVCVVGEAWLEDALRAFAGLIKVVRLELDEPIQLGLAARQLLLEADPIADLTIYMEDDLVIHDPLFFEKQLWFLERTQHQAVLMPHRYEVVPAAGAPPRRFYVDGGLMAEALACFPWQPAQAAAQGRFRGEIVEMDRPSNPHSGLFVLSAPQVQALQRDGVPPLEWVGPLETAATYSVAHRFPVFKPSWVCREFLGIEHAHHSYAVYLQQHWAASEAGR